MDILDISARPGPRLAGRLTAELIMRSPQYMNCMGLYHLDLRGNRVAAVENLGATQNQFGAVDLSDNSVVRLEGFPCLERMKMVICNNNRITSIAPELPKQLPNLDTLVLTSNRLDRLADVATLGNCKRLTHLCLLDNPVAGQKDFRLFTIYHLKSLKVLNFRKVTAQERTTAQEKMVMHAIEQVSSSAQAGKEPVKEVSHMVVSDKAGGSSEPREMTEDERMAVQVAIQSAATLEEVHRLEAALKAGQLPTTEPRASDVDPSDAMEE